MIRLRAGVENARDDGGKFNRLRVRERGVRVALRDLRPLTYVQVQRIAHATGRDDPQLARRERGIGGRGNFENELLLIALRRGGLRHRNAAAGGFNRDGSLGHRSRSHDIRRIQTGVAVEDDLRDGAQVLARERDLDGRAALNPFRRNGRQLRRGLGHGGQRRGEEKQETTDGHGWARMRAEASHKILSPFW